MNQLGVLYMPRKPTGKPPGRPNIVWEESPTEQITFKVPPTVKEAWKNPDYNFQVKQFMEEKARKLKST